MNERKAVRVFIIEDEGGVLLEMEINLEDMDYEVVGSAADLDRGLALARELSFDLAVLDVDLAGRNSGPIADVLEQSDNPFLFARWVLARGRARWPRAQAPGLQAVGCGAASRGPATAPDGGVYIAVDVLDLITN